MEEQGAGKSTETQTKVTQNTLGLETRMKRFGLKLPNSEKNRAMGTETERQVGRGQQSLHSCLLKGIESCNTKKGRIQETGVRTQIQEDQRH